MQIDCQAHLIDPARFPFPQVRQGFVPGSDEYGDAETLARLLDDHGVSHAVLVAASVYGADNTILFGASEQDPGRYRLVISPPLDKQELRDVARHPDVVGARLNLVDGIFDRAHDLAEQAVEAGLCLHLQASPRAATELVARLGSPGSSIVLDHFGRPDLANDELELDSLISFLRAGSTWLKASAAFRMRRVPKTRLVQLLRAVGPDRVLWGSDWPFINAAGPKPTYRDTLGLLARLMGDEEIDWQRAADRNAARLYGFDISE